MHAHNAHLDGWSLSSRSGSALFKPGIGLNMNYVLITPDSLQSPLGIDSLGDSLVLHSSSGPFVDWLFFGNWLNSEVIAPLSGQSISRHDLIGFYYLDNTPTVGSPNDSLNAIGTLIGDVRESATALPIAGVLVETGVNSATTDDWGTFEIHDYARTVSVAFSHPNYLTERLTVVLRPELTSLVQVEMEPISSVPESGQPMGIMLNQNYPNPFNPSTAIAYHLPHASRVTLSVYSVSGEKIAELQRGVRPPGDHIAQWDGKNEDDVMVASGVYLARFQATELPRGTTHTQTIKLLLLR